MKNFKILIALLILFTPLFFTGCTKLEAKALAEELDSTIKNFINSTNNLDWPTDENLESLEKDDISSDETNIDTDIDTTEIYAWIEHLHSKINILLSKRGDLLLFVNEMYSGNTELSNENLIAIKVYMDIIKDNSNYLSKYNGMLKNQINEASRLTSEQSNVNLINAYIVKAVETLETRSAKIDTSILAMNSIIDIISKHLLNNYFNYNKYELNEEETLPPEPIDENQEITQQDKSITENNSTDTENGTQQKENINVENNNQIDINIEDDSSKTTDKIAESTQKEPSIEKDTTMEDETLIEESVTKPLDENTSDAPITRETIKEQII